MKKTKLQNQKLLCLFFVALIYIHTHIHTNIHKQTYLYILSLILFNFAESLALP
jgi:hypothetical protein